MPLPEIYFVKDDPYGIPPIQKVLTLAALYSIQNGHEKIERSDLQQALAILKEAADGIA